VFEKWAVVMNTPPSFHMTPLGGCGKMSRFVGSFLLLSLLFQLAGVVCMCGD